MSITMLFILLLHILATTTTTTMALATMLPSIPRPLPKKENKIFASVEHMKPLLDIEKPLVAHARKYLAKQRKLLNDLGSFKRELEEAVQWPENRTRSEYVGNPVNAFLMIKRLSGDWFDVRDYLSGLQDEPSIHETIEKDAPFLEKFFRKETPQWLETYNTYRIPVSSWIGQEHYYPPSQSTWSQIYAAHTPATKDLDGALSAFIRLQDTYHIEARDFADGTISFLGDFKLQMTAGDCMAIVGLCYNSKRYVRMKQWLLEAERLIDDVTMPHRHGNTTKKLVYEWLVYSYFLENDAKNSLKYTNRLLEDFPANPTYLQNKYWYGWFVENNVRMSRVETGYMAQAKAILDYKQQSDYVQACVKELHPKGFSDEWNLRCFVKQDHPLLLLKPIKVSQMHDNPPVYIFHDLLPEKTTDELKRLATPRIKHAKIVHMKTNELAEEYYRVSKSMFLLPDVASDMELNDRMHPLFEAVTGLSMKYAETLQMNNYGLGGQYELHHDYGEPGTMLDKDPLGNRMATLLLYLSEVEYGGHTVFPFLGLSVRPKKGDGVFWYNLHRSGKGITNTRHAACPVLSGSKWVANKWIRMGGNEFKRSCSLNRFE